MPAGHAVEDGNAAQDCRLSGSVGISMQKTITNLNLQRMQPSIRISSNCWVPIVISVAALLAAIMPAQL